MHVRTITSHETRTRSAGFWLWGWAMLLVVLLSAAPTGGAPRTQWLGSAFDPATTSVTTGPKRPKVDILVKKAADDEPYTFVPVPTPLLAAPARPADLRGISTAARPATFARSFQAAATVSPLAGSHAARAPPVA